MNKPNVTKYFKMATKIVKKRSPEILTGLGIAGMITTTVLAVKATPKALELIEEEKRFKEKEAHEGGIFTKEDEKKAFRLTPFEVVKAAWKPYVPAALIGTASIACLIGANSVHTRRHAALYSAYKLSESALTEYKEKVVETIGEKKEKKVREEIAKDKVEQHPVTKTEIFMTGNGDSLFYDPLSDRYFTSNIEAIRKAINDLNYSMGYSSEMYVSLSQLYDLLDLKHTAVSDDIGWNISDGLIEPDFSAQISDDGRPCVVLDFLLAPKYNFDNLY